jgi:hypothetical protein
MELIRGVDGYNEQRYTDSLRYDGVSFFQKVRRRLANSFNYGTPEFFMFKNRYARVLQSKNYIQDYILKDRYKAIKYCQEFQQELTFVLPFAYWHYLNGTLGKTISSRFTRELYFFSSQHEERYEKRVDRLAKDSYEIPNMFHCKTFYFHKWARVPLKEQYKNDLFVFEKPLLVIANKYNTEWGTGPINYFSIPVLDKILSKFSQQFQIVYNRPGASHIVMDNSAILELKEEEFIRKNYPEVILAENLYQSYRNQVNNYNHFQLMLYANCDHFLSVHGGAAALASYFGGKNIILSKSGYEHRYNEFNTIFPALSGAEIFHAKEEKDIFKFLDMHYLL